MSNALWASYGSLGTVRYVWNMKYIMDGDYLGLMKDQEGAKHERKGRLWYALRWMLGKSIMDENGENIVLSFIGIWVSLAKGCFYMPCDLSAQ